MGTEDLGTYLQDHYAGSVGAVELLDHLISTHGGDPFEIFFSELRTDITVDQGELSDFMHALEVQESGLRFKRIGRSTSNFQWTKNEEVVRRR